MSTDDDDSDVSTTQTTSEPTTQPTTKPPVVITRPGEHEMLIIDFNSLPSTVITIYSLSWP